MGKLASLEKNTQCHRYCADVSTWYCLPQIITLTFYLDRYRASRHNATRNTLEPSDIVNLTNVHWLDFAYTQYVTNSNYLCNSVMMFEALDRLGSKADRVMMYPPEWEVPDTNSSSTSEEGKLLRDAKDRYKVNLVPIFVQTSAGQELTWQDSFTKLLAFNQT